MKYLFFLFSLSLFSCGQKTESDSENSSENKIASIQTEITALDSLVIQCKDFEISLKELEFLAVYWAKEQSTSDAQEKMRLLEVEKTCFEQLQKMEDNSKNELKDIAKSLRVDLDSALMITKEIRTLLPDFASYEDMSDLFFAQVMVEDDLSMAINRIAHRLQTFTRTLSVKKEHLIREIEKIRGGK